MDNPENTERVIKNEQSRETGNIGYKRRRKTQHNMCWTPLYAKNANNVNKTWALVQTTGGKDKLNIVYDVTMQNTVYCN